VRRLRFVQLAAGHEVVLHQAAHPLQFARGAPLARLRRRHVGAHGGGGRAARFQPRPRFLHRGLARLHADQGRLEDGAPLVHLGARDVAHERNLGPRRADAGFRHRHRRPQLIAARLVVARVHAQEHVALLDRLVIAHEQLGHVSAHLGAHGRDRALDVGVVGRDLREIAVPHAAAEDDDGDHGNDGEHDHDAASHGRPPALG
jgi:hypothetical protein